MLKKVSTKLKSIIKQDFIKQAATLFGGSALGQLLLLMFTPFLARIYSAEAFGIYTVYSSVMMIATMISTLRYEYAIALPESEEDAFGLLHLNFYLSFCISLMMALIILCFNKPINLFFNLPANSIAFYFLPISVFINGGIQAMNYFLLRHHKYKTISVAGMMRNISTISVQAAAIKLYTGIGLVLGALVGLSVTSAIYLKSVFMDKTRVSIKPNFSTIIGLAKRYKKIPIYTFTADLAGNLSAQLPTMMIGSIFGLEAAAFYGIANRLVMSSFQLIGQSVGQVFFGKSASNLRQNRQHYALARKTVLSLFYVGVVPLTILGVFAHPIFNLILGSNWDTAASIAQVMVPWWLASFIAMPVVDLFSVIGQQRFHLYFMSSQLIVRATCLYVGASLFHSMVATMAAFSCISCILSVLMIFVLLKKAKDFDLEKKDGTGA